MFQKLRDCLQLTRVEGGYLHVPLQYLSFVIMFTYNVDVGFSFQSQERNQGVRQDLNESTLDLSLGLTSHDDERDSESKPSHMRDGQ